MSSASRESGGISFEVDRLLFLQNGSYGFEGHTEINVLTVGDAALDASAVVGGGCGTTVYGTEDVVLLGASGGDAVEALTVFEAFDGIDAQHRSA